MVELRWTGPADAGRGTIQVAAYALIGVVAEGTTAIAEIAEPRGPTFEVVTGLLADQTQFASHGHTLRLRIDVPPAAGAAPSVDA